MEPLPAQSGRESPFAADVRAGLTARRKTLPPKYFYDELGSQLFEAICALPEYYLTRCETEILSQHAPAIASYLPRPTSIVELGSGSSVKTRYLLEALLARQETLLYQPIDISESMLSQSTRHLLLDYPNLRIQAQAGDYTHGLGAVKRAQDGALLVLFLGSNIGNYDPHEAQRLLTTLQRSLRPGDLLLLGADLKKAPALLEAAYDDALGVTAAFNRNLLVRINRELRADFDLKKFAHRAHYNVEDGRVEMYLVSQEVQEVHLRSLNISVQFQRGETIHTENSWKFDLEQLQMLAAQSGFAAVHSWLDQGKHFSCNLWQVATARHLPV
ncbi:MAG: L-histidine N(alpha)-methyltransferase [Acidobacteria bacterium]|nr:L-histidine N(alpha)-methyltransferase [Acidobacteriota bacterium]